MNMVSSKKLESPYCTKLNYSVQTDIRIFNGELPKYYPLKAQSRKPNFMIRAFDTHGTYFLPSTQT